MKTKLVLVFGAVAICSTLAGAMQAEPAVLSCENDKCSANTQCVGTVNTGTGCDVLSGNVLCKTYECEPS